MKASGPSVVAALERRTVVTGTRAAEMRAQRLAQQFQLSARFLSSGPHLRVCPVGTSHRTGRMWIYSPR